MAQGWSSSALARWLPYWLFLQYVYMRFREGAILLKKIHFRFFWYEFSFFPFTPFPFTPNKINLGTDVYVVGVFMRVYA